MPAQLHIAGIVAPLDGAPYAERSIPYAVAAARTTGSGLLLVHVGDRADSLRAEKGEPDAAAYLRALRGRVSDMAPDEIRVDTLAVEGLSVAAAVLQIVEREHAGLIVLATHARQGIERRLLGSVGDQLVEQGHTPILFIPPRVEVPAAPPAISRALVPLDGSAVAEQAIEPMLGLVAPASGAVETEIVLFQVVENVTLRDDAARYLATIRDALVARGLPAGVRVTAVAVVGSAPGAIVAAAERGIIDEAVAPGTFDMVAMGTHGRGGLQRWLYGSVTSYVLPRIAVPALLVRPVRTDM